MVEQLNPGALPHQFKALEAYVPDLPQEFYDLYLINNGKESNYDVPSILLGLIMLNLDEIAKDYKVWKDILKNYPEYGQEEGLSFPSGHIKTDYINLGRISILGDTGGNFVGIDLDPGPLGQKGQIINFGRDQEDKYVIASSLGEFLEFVLEYYQTGRAVVRLDEWGESRIMWTEKSGEGLLSAIPQIFVLPKTE